MPEYVELLERIAARLVNYRHGEIPPIYLSHVARWVEQFAFEDRLTILSETNRMLERRYVTQDEMTQSVEQLLTLALAGLQTEQLNRVQFLEIARKGGSQRSLTEMMRQAGLELFGRDFTQPQETPTIFLYVDDCLFTGNTVLNDLRDWLIAQEPGSSIERLCLLFHTVHSGGRYYVDTEIGRDQRLGRLKDKTLIQSTKAIQNSRSRDDTKFTSHAYECFWPETPATLSTDLQRITSQLPSEARLYRPTSRTPHSSLFSTPETRSIVERNFLEKGAFIMARPKTVQLSMRPLGYESLPSLGFGAMYVTHRNISNNCPLVLWWGDPNAPAYHPLRAWYPLIPRLANEGQAS